MRGSRRTPGARWWAIVLTVVTCLAADQANAYTNPMAYPWCEARSGITPEFIRNPRVTHWHWLDGWSWPVDARVVYDPDAFFDLMGPSTWLPYGRTGTLVQYIRKEDGLMPPVRTGKEVALYEAIKRVARDANSDWHSLGLRDILALALHASLDQNQRANISIAILTAHNVMRALARPQQWYHDDANHPVSDPMYPIFQDLRSPSAGSLPSILKTRRGFGMAADRSGRLLMDWMPRLFSADKGLFKTLDGAENEIWNGGAHYYFWIGALAQLHAPSLVGGGGYWWELGLKASAGEYSQGVMQLSHFACGRLLADRIYENSSMFGTPGAPIRITSVDAPSPAINNAPAEDVHVFWTGDATFPVTITIYPVRCDAGGCITQTRSFSVNENPLVMKDASFCYGYSQSHSSYWEGVLKDANGFSSPPYPLHGSCVVPK